jgi:hypothetical protein
MRYPADPPTPTIDEIVDVMRHTGDDRHGWRLRAMIVVLGRAGLRRRSRSPSTPSTPGASPTRPQRQGDSRREVGMDE